MKKRKEKMGGGMEKGEEVGERDIYIYENKEQTAEGKGEFLQRVGR